MSEYWVSKDKYFCKYCNIFIADDKPSRNLHETGLRHKGNYERFIRDIYKRGAKDQRDKAEEAREMERINAAANAAMSADGFASTSTSTLPPPRARPAPVPSSSDPYANYSTAESLGYVDPEADKLVAEVEARQTEGRIGEWQRVAKPAFVPKHATAAAVKTEAKAEDGAPPAEEDEEPVRRKGYLGEQTRQLDDDIAFDPTKVAFKLKRQRLTLKEEDDLRVAAEDEARVKKEAERRERKERKAAGLDKSGWAEVAHEEESMLLFAEEEPKPGEGLVEGEGEDAKPDVKPAVAGPTFKKRKGNAAVRSKE